MGKTLILIGLLIVAIGIVVSFLPKDMGIPRLPGDIYIKKNGFTLYFPWVTSLVLSVVLSLIFYIFFRK